MSMPVRAVVLVATLIVSLPAHAQFLGLGFESNIELTKQDLAIIRSTVDAQIHGKTVGTSASWTNPESGNYGTITLVKKYAANGLSCESVGYTLATKRMAVPPEHYMLNSCLLADGKWRIT
jgi:surface antigen